jgi:hypothetical protein
MEINPMNGDKMQEIIFGLLNSPQDVRERVKVALEPKKEHTLETLPAPP